MFNRILAIAKNTFRESIRDRILLSALVVMLLLIVFSLFIGSISLGQDTRMVVDFGLTAIYILQIFVAIFIGSMLIYKEIERKTFFLIIPKPIERGEIILGKCLGLSATTIAVSSISVLTLFVILALKGMHEFYFPILVAVSLSLLESALLILLSILFSGLTSPILSAVYTFAFYLIGHSTAILRELIANQSGFFSEYALKGAYYLLPNLEKFNVRNDVIFATLPDGRGIIAAVMYAFAAATASGTALPPASPAAIAAENVQPVPCV